MKCKHDCYRFEVSVIMSVYNVERYLREAVDSVISQTIGFKEHVQLIFVNDGSLDQSEEICLAYKAEYPDNIVYVKQENKGLAGAKNTGLKYREGKYISFFDPDDILEKNTLAEVTKFFDRHYEMISQVAIPIYYFEAKEGLHQKYEFMGKKNKVINLYKEPYSFVLSSASCFYKTEVFDHIQFNENMRTAEDTLLNAALCRENPLFGYVCERHVRYHYRKREEGGSLVDESHLKPEYFASFVRIWDALTQDMDKEALPAYIKEYALYTMRSLVRDIRPTIFSTEEAYAKMLDDYRHIIEKIGAPHIAYATKMLTTKAAKYVFLSKILNEEHPFTLMENGAIACEGCLPFSIDGFEIKLMKVSMRRKNIRLELIFGDYNIPNIELLARNNNGREYAFKDISRFSTAFDVKYGGFKVSETTRAILDLPYRKNKISFFVRSTETGKEYMIQKISVNPKSRLSLDDRSFMLFNHKFHLYKTQDEIIIKEREYPTRQYNKDTYKLLKEKYDYKAPLRLFTRRTKKYILVNDRPEKAGDNGEAIFKYINTYDKELAKYTYFVISKDCADYRRLKRYGHVVAKGSLKHKLLYLNSRAILSSHAHPLFYKAYMPEEEVYYRDVCDYKFVWLQHGIIENDVSKSANQYTSYYDYMVYSTYNEEKELTQDQYLIYEKDNLLATGLPRFDYLENTPVNLITIAPTWRTFLSGPINDRGFHDTRPDFENSDFYRAYADILTSPKLQDMLKKHDYYLQFVLHPGMAGYKASFDKLASDRIVIVGAESVEYSRVFCESRLLITDYSSVAFDFAYMKKPVIYYQFDKEQFFSGHYGHGIYSYDKDGLGEVLMTKDALLQKIGYYFEHNFVMEKLYTDRVEHFYIHNDHNNCKRLIDLLKGKNVL